MRIRMRAVVPILSVSSSDSVLLRLSVGMLLLPWPRTAHSQLLLLLGENLGQSFEILTLMLERCGVTTSSKTTQPGELELHSSSPHNQHHWMNKMSGGKKEKKRRKEQEVDIKTTERSSSSLSSSSSSSSFSSSSPSPPSNLHQDTFSLVTNPTFASQLGVLEGLRTHPEAKTLISDLRKRFSLIQTYLEDSRRELLVFPFIPVLFLQAYFVWRWTEGRIQPFSKSSSLTPSASPGSSPDCPATMATLRPVSSSPSPLNIFNPPRHLFKSVEQLERVAKSLALLSEHLDGMVQVEVNTLTSGLHRSFLEQLHPNLLQIGSELYNFSNELFAAVTGRPGTSYLLLFFSLLFLHLMPAPPFPLPLLTLTEPSQRLTFLLGPLAFKSPFQLVSVLLIL
jgi:hypothetical protein